MKKIGCCTLCDAECFEVRKRFTEGPVAGWPRLLGPPLEGARRVHLVFQDGTTGAVTLCADCEVDLPRIFDRVREAWAFEGTNGKREHLGGESLTLAQQWLMGADQLRRRDNPPLGVLMEESWRQAIARETEYGRTAR